MCVQAICASFNVDGRPIFFFLNKQKKTKQPREKNRFALSMRDKYRHSEYERIIRIIVEHRNKRVIHSLVIVVIQNRHFILGMHITDSTILRGSTLVHSAHSHTQTKTRRVHCTHLLLAVHVQRVLK